MEIFTVFRVKVPKMLLQSNKGTNKCESKQTLASFASKDEKNFRQAGGVIKPAQMGLIRDPSENS